jgi:SAM-dependent methyltransferase
VPWDARTYDERFGFVASHGRCLVDLLDPQPGEAVLDLGAGTGHLAARIADRGAKVLGIDADEQMVASARSQHPGVAFAVAQAATFTVAEPVDAVFSNATLHWVPATQQAAVLDRVRTALRPGGRFVAEMGGAGNVSALVRAANKACVQMGLAPVEHPWCFPSPAEQAARLEAAGFTVRQLEYFDRPTSLTPPDTAADWFVMFGRYLLESTPPVLHDQLLAEIDRRAATALRTDDGSWTADYVRLRWYAVAR